MLHATLLRNNVAPCKGTFSDKMDAMANKIDYLTQQLQMKEARINELEGTVKHLQSDLDKSEQYSRRANLRIQGIPESGGGENTDAKVVAILNDTMGLVPRIELSQIERSHRIGPKVDKQGRLRTRQVIWTKDIQCYK